MLLTNSQSTRTWTGATRRWETLRVRGGLIIRASVGGRTNMPSNGCAQNTTAAERVVNFIKHCLLEAAIWSLSCSIRRSCVKCTCCIVEQSVFTVLSGLFTLTIYLCLPRWLKRPRAPILCQNMPSRIRAPQVPDRRSSVNSVDFLTSPHQYSVCIQFVTPINTCVLSSVWTRVRVIVEYRSSTSLNEITTVFKFLVFEKWSTSKKIS
jgi:hypothetical protein